MAIFLSWVQNIVFYPTGLSFAAAALAFTFGGADLAGNNIYVGLFTVVAFWLCTLVALVSARFAAKVTQFGFVLGTAVPGLVLVAAFGWWVLAGHQVGWSAATDPSVAVPTEGHPHPRWFPHVAGLAGLGFLAGILLNFAGVESQAVHANELANPRRGYPVVIMIAAVVSFAIFTLGALAVAGILKYQDISGAIIFTAAPLVLERFRRPSWMPPEDLAVRHATGRVPPQERRVLAEHREEREQV